jgi:hypothetical protein
MTEKRSHSHGFKARKRQKIESPANLSHHTIRKTRKARKRGKDGDRKAVSLNSLSWRTVDMPDRLDDVEGFMGLEEVDDVEVINNNGLLEFKVGLQPVAPRYQQAVEMRAK